MRVRGWSAVLALAVFACDGTGGEGLPVGRELALDAASSLDGQAGDVGAPGPGDPADAAAADAPAGLEDAGGPPDDGGALLEDAGTPSDGTSSADSDAQPEDGGAAAEDAGTPADGAAVDSGAPPIDAIGPPADANSPPDSAGPDLVDRVVIAGDSWSVGLALPTQDALAALGYGAIPVSFETTVVGGSTAEDWASNDGNKLLLLAAALDAQPPAELLILTIGGNDLNSAIGKGLGLLPAFLKDAALDGILANIESLLNTITTGRPHLEVLVVGYDFLHYDLLKTYNDLPHYDTESYNDVLIELESRKRALIAGLPGVHYAHNFGILQHTVGDVPHPPFLLPPIAYAPGTVPKPGGPPAYSPFPGGLKQLPDRSTTSPTGSIRRWQASGSSSTTAWRRAGPT